VEHSTRSVRRASGYVLTAKPDKWIWRWRKYPMGVPGGEEKKIQRGKKDEESS